MSKVTGALMDGWAHELVAGEDFAFPVSRHQEVAQEPTGEEEPYELPIPELLPPEDHGAIYHNPLPWQFEQQAWAALCISLKELAKILGGHADSFQENTYDGGRISHARFTFRFIPGEKTWKGGRL